jgi:amino acid transporter
MLTRSLTLTDLVLFGIAANMGSGGFSLIGTGVHEGGAWWPLALLLAGVLMMGASFTYSDAFERFRSNTAESDIVRNAFGPFAEMIGTGSIVFYSLASIVVILILCANIVLPGGSWLSHVAITIASLGGMSAIALGGMDLDKQIITGFTWSMIGVLLLASLLGLSTRASDSDSSPSPNFMNSLWMFLFVLIGFDVLMKFAEETDDAIPAAFYLSNGLSILLTATVGAAIAHGLPRSQQNMTAIASLFAATLGDWVFQPVRWIIVLYLLLTAFIVFLGTSRYIYSLGKDTWLQSTNAVNAPWASITAVFGSGSVLALLNQVKHLVVITDVGFSIIAALVAGSVTVANWREEKFGVAAVSGATAAGFSGLIAAFISSV